MPARSPSEFTLDVLQLIRAIPEGKVATYSQIAALAGKPHGARGVAWILHSMSTSQRLPWHRVLGSKGTISFPPRATNFREQKKRLVREGVVFRANGVVDLAEYQWKKKPRKAKSSAKTTPKMFG